MCIRDRNCHIFERPFDPQYAANDIIMSAMGNNGVVLVCPGDAAEYQDGHGQTEAPTMWRQYFIIASIYHNASLFPATCLTPDYYLRAFDFGFHHRRCGKGKRIPVPQGFFNHVPNRPKIIIRRCLLYTS